MAGASHLEDSKEIESNLVVRTYHRDVVEVSGKGRVFGVSRLYYLDVPL